MTTSLESWLKAGEKCVAYYSAHVYYIGILLCILAQGLEFGTLKQDNHG